MTRKQILDRNAKVAQWYLAGNSLKQIVARTGLGHRQIYRILVKQKIERRGWQDRRRKAA